LRLGNVATLSMEEGPAVVNHVNISRVTDVYVNVQHGYDVGTVVTQIEEKLEQLGAKSDSDERGNLYRIGYLTNKEIIAALELTDQQQQQAQQIIADSEVGTGILGNPDIKDILTEQQEVTWNQLSAEPLSEASIYKGVSFRMMGEVKSMRESCGQFIGGLVIATILVYLVMVAQFRSFLDPLIVLLTVPLGFIGVVAILLITNTHLSIMAFMGIIMMVGIVVEYSIILVDFANRRMEEGLTVREAILDAAKVRLRPILMTSMTTWLALLPMAIGFGGGDANAPLARAIIGGVIGATVLSLIVVPCLYVMFKRNPKPVAIST
ncbi:MAG: efflux RND transporter permease subunit, partial [Planctomycetales bacterium]